MAENRYSASASIPSTYKDTDGIQRWGDYGLDGNPSSGTLAMNPYKTSDQTYRPILLDRPFHSVGELGYVYRDMPWKTLDLYSTNSADMVLLDLFDSCEHPPMVAGKLSWNVTYPEIWKTLIAGADRAYGAADAKTISDDDAQKIADLIYQSYAGKDRVPVSRSDMIRALTTTTVSSTWPAFKHQREVVARQIAEVGQSSTMNLFMDLVIEEGKTKLNTSKKAQFITQGRRRYWISFALDRLTYKIIDKRIEEVF